MQEQTEMTTPVDLGSTWILTLISKEILLVDIFSTTFWKRFDCTSVCMNISYMQVTDNS